METEAPLSLTAENLINTYQNEEVLWRTDLNSSEEMKSLAWQRLGDLFKAEISVLKKKITSYRSGLAKEIREEKKATRSGSGKRTTVVYTYANMLSFLRPYMKIKTLRDNLKRGNEENDKDDDEDEANDFDVEENTPHLSTSPNDTALENIDDSQSEQPVKKAFKSSDAKKKVLEKRDPEDKQLHELALNANKVLVEISKRRVDTADEARSKEAATSSKDWTYAQLIYNHLKDIDDSEEKDDLELNILRLISETKRKISRQKSAVAAHSFSPPFVNQYGVSYYQQNPVAYDERYGGYSSTTYGPGFESAPGLYRPPQIMHQIVQQRRSASTDSSVLNVTSPGSVIDPTCSDADESSDIATVVMRHM